MGALACISYFFWGGFESILRIVKHSDLCDRPVESEMNRRNHVAVRSLIPADNIVCFLLKCKFIQVLITYEITHSHLNSHRFLSHSFQFLDSFVVLHFKQISFTFLLILKTINDFHLFQISNYLKIIQVFECLLWCSDHLVSSLWTHFGNLLSFFFFWQEPIWTHTCSHVCLFHWYATSFTFDFSCFDRYQAHVQNVHIGLLLCVFTRAA